MSNFHFIIRAITITLLFFIHFYSHAQREIKIDVLVEYENVYLETGQGSIYVGFSPKNGSWNSEKSFPIISLSSKITYKGAKFVLQDFESVPLESAELAAIDKNSIANVIEPRVKVVAQRFENYCVVEIDAVFYNETSGKYEKILTVSGSIQQENIATFRTKSFKTNSVLSSGSGEWHRIGVEKAGLFKVDYNFLVNHGVKIQGINSSQISIYGNDHAMLSHENSDFREDDLKQQAVLMYDGGDGKFDAGDYLVFYASGPHEIKANGPEWQHINNNYTDTAYYFVNISSTANSSAVQNASLSSATRTHSVNTFSAFQYLEEDDVNLAKSGVEWLGDIFDVQLSNSYSFTFPNISTSDSIIIRSNIGVSSPVNGNSSTCEFALSVGNSSLSLKPVGSGQGSTSYKCRFASGFLKTKVSSDIVNVNLQFNKNGLPSSKGYLDYIEVNAMRRLTMEGSQMAFANLQTVGFGNVTEYNINNATNIKYVWEITNPTSPKNVAFTRNGSSLSFKVATDTVRKFIAFTDNQYYTPTYFSSVENQNLHGLESRDMIIISPPVFNAAAQRLAAFHKTEGITSHIVSQQEIFNEFSSGMRDPVAIKQFLKMFYDRAAGDPTLAPRFCLIMGDCSYDYRNRLNSKSDYVITYESTESMAASSFSTDDFYVILDDTEGMNGSDLMDMSVGRLPVQTLQEAEGVVDKIISHSPQKVTMLLSQAVQHAIGWSRVMKFLGDWRNVVTIVSDDGDANAYFYDVENMANDSRSSDHA